MGLSSPYAWEADYQATRPCNQIPDFLLDARMLARQHPMETSSGCVAGWAHQQTTLGRPQRCHYGRSKGLPTCAQRGAPSRRQVHRFGTESLHPHVLRLCVLTSSRAPGPRPYRARNSSAPQLTTTAVEHTSIPRANRPPFELPHVALPRLCQSDCRCSSSAF